MKNFSISFFLGFILLFCAVTLKAQPKVVVKLDTIYAHGGKVEFPLSQFGDEITDFYGVFPDVADISNVTICGKVGTADPHIKKLGLVQLKASGTFDSSFGNNGKFIANWGVSDYPNSMFVVSDNSGGIFLAGANGSSAAASDQIPAIYKFKKNGVPDSAFGGDGHVAVRYDSASRGEFTMVTSVATKFLAAGKSTANTPNGHTGFCSMRFLTDGRIDSTYGVAGKALIQANVHSVFAFLTSNASVTFIGVADLIDSDPPRLMSLVLARLTSKGTPDSSFGTNGILSTSKLVSEEFGNLVAGIQPDYKIVAGLPPIGAAGLMPVTLLRLAYDGSIDSSYGTNGFATVAFTPGQSKARGINIAKNGKTVVAGSAVGALEQCATSRNNLDGTPDITLNQIGTAVVDVDSGAYSNSLIRFVGIGNKRYIGVGSSIHNGLSQFLIARFKDDTLSSGAVLTKIVSSNLLEVFPNPSSSTLTIEAKQAIEGEIKVTDALGREVISLNRLQYSFDRKECSFSCSQLPNGMYYCIVQLGKEKVVRKFIVAY